MAVVARLRVAPVKGLATVLRDQIHLDEEGVAEDRRLFLLDRDGAVVTMRSHPQLVQVVPDLDLDGALLGVTLPDGAVVSSPLRDAAQPVSARLFGKERNGRVLPGAVADALSHIAGEPLRLVLADATGVGWDEGPVSILGQASAAAVGGDDHDAARYRMLIEVEGTAAYEEDTWVGRQLDLGDARVRVTHPLERCVVITKSPTTGSPDWDGLRVLAEQRGRDRLCLGVIAEVVKPGRVEVGAPVRVQSGGLAWS